MNEAMNPKTIHPPLAPYTHTVRVPPNAEWLAISGQLGVDAKGRLAGGAKRQAEQAFRNILACLKANKMAKAHLVKLNVYLTDSRFIADYRAARQKVLGDGALPASTLAIVDGLAAPDYLVEIEAWAAKP
ncbi:MAG: RidA family protein [Alphaproteobacteria bacterium]|nr:RidA family protein [Alphaproteobacteria bacterium]